MRLALQECGRKLGTYLRRRQRMRRESERRHVFARYIGEIAMACERITGTDAAQVKSALEEIAATKTAEADHQLDDEGRVIDDGGRLAHDDDVIILDPNDSAPATADGGGGASDSGAGTLFGGGEDAGSKRRTSTKKKSRKKTGRSSRGGSR